MTQIHKYTCPKTYKLWNFAEKVNKHYGYWTILLHYNVTESSAELIISVSIEHSSKNCCSCVECVHSLFKSFNSHPRLKQHVAKILALRWRCLSTMQNHWWENRQKRQSSPYGPTFQLWNINQSPWWQWPDWSTGFRELCFLEAGDHLQNIWRHIDNGKKEKDV